MSGRVWLVGLLGYLHTDGIVQLLVVASYHRFLAEVDQKTLGKEKNKLT